MTVTALPRTYVAPMPQESPWSLAVLGAPAVAFVTYGAPGPQGSKAFKGMRTSKKTGKQVAVLAESSKKVEPWRKVVAQVASLATRQPGWEALAGPLVVDMVFTLKRPQSFPKNNPFDLRWRHGKATAYPDVSKLARSTEDAITKMVWHDDARVVAYRRLEKVYVGADDPDALRTPGVVFRVWEL